MHFISIGRLRCIKNKHEYVSLKHFFLQTLTFWIKLSKKEIIDFKSYSQAKHIVAGRPADNALVKFINKSILSYMIGGCSKTSF